MSEIIRIAVIAGLCALSAPAGGQVVWHDINPDQTNLGDQDGASGGRVHHLATLGDTFIVYGASEWGGIFRSPDRGNNWAHLDGHVPHAAWDVAVQPGEPKRVYATSLYDGRTASIAGISVSTDGGDTWAHPVWAAPAAFCAGLDSPREPAAFGISVDPANPNNAYVGTNCGLAISRNRGLNSAG
jgi:hypothetical protein